MIFCGGDRTHNKILTRQYDQYPSLKKYTKRKIHIGCLQRKTALKIKRIQLLVLNKKTGKHK